MPASLKHLSELLNNKQKTQQMSLFAKWPANRLYYLVDLVKLDHTNRRATVRFEDKQEFECILSELHLQLLESDIYADLEDIICCACDGDKSDKNNEIVICETCQQGFHQKCHDPRIPNTVLQPSQSNEDWTCSTCEYMLSQSKVKKIPGEYSSTPAASGKKPKKIEPKADKQFKAPKTTRVKLPDPPNIKAKALAQEKTKREPAATVPDVSSEDSLTTTLGKLTTEVGVEIDEVPIPAARVAQTLMSREPIKTPDLVNAITDKNNKALELEQEDIVDAIKGPGAESTDLINGAPAVNQVKTKADKPVAKKVVAKRTVTNKAPRKVVRKTAPAPA